MSETKVVYRLTISVPELIPGQKIPKDVVVVFKDADEKAAYIKEEHAYCETALKRLAGAWTKEERFAAYKLLYDARKAFNSKWKKEPVEKEIA